MTTPGDPLMALPPPAPSKYVPGAVPHPQHQTPQQAPYLTHTQNLPGA